MSANSVLVQFADNAVCYDSNASEITGSLTTHFKYCTGSGSAIIGNYDVTRQASGRYSARLDETDLFTDLEFQPALWHLMQDTLLRLNGASRTELIFHAAALAYHDRAVILCGGSGSGKSSLAAWLTAGGLQYMGDEVVSLPSDGQEIHGFCRSLVLKPGSAFIWNHWLTDVLSDGFLRFGDNSAWLDPSLLSTGSIQTKAFPRVLVFPQFKDGSQFQIARLTPARSLFHLLQHLANARNFPDFGMAAAARLARQTESYTLMYSDIEVASQWIRTTIQAS